MKSAIIRTGGKQYVVTEGKKIKIEKLPQASGEKIALEALLLADNDQVEIGTPILDKKIEAKIVRQGKGDKVIGIKFKRKTRQRKKFGHRQLFTEIEITKI